MPSQCSQHTSPQLSCHTCYSSEELEQQVSYLQSLPVPQPRGQGSKSKPKRSDAPLKEKKKSWRDALGFDK